MMAPEQCNSTGELPRRAAATAGGADAPPAPPLSVTPTGAASAPAIDAADFAAQFQAAYRVLWLVAVGIVGDRSAADDVVQESALLALEKLAQFQPGTNFRAWMAQMVRFVALNQARRQQKHRTVGQRMGTQRPIPDGSTASSDDPARGPGLRLGKLGQLPPDQAEFDDRLMLALNSVPDVPRSCLLLRTLEQLEYAEISRLLGIPEGTAMSHVHRTRQYLRERLADLAPRATNQTPNDATEGGRP